MGEKKWDRFSLLWHKQSISCECGKDLLQAFTTWSCCCKHEFLKWHFRVVSSARRVSIDILPHSRIFKYVYPPSPRSCIFAWSKCFWHSALYFVVWAFSMLLVGTKMELVFPHCLYAISERVCDNFILLFAKREVLN